MRIPNLSYTRQHAPKDECRIKNDDEGDRMMRKKFLSYRSKLAIGKFMIKNLRFSFSVILVNKYEYVNSTLKI